MDQHESMPDPVKTANDNSTRVPPGFNGEGTGTPPPSGLPPNTAESGPGEPSQEDNRSWLAQNAPSLLFVVSILALLLYFHVDLWMVVKAAVGLSAVIFIHELGHFLVAKWCDVNVTTFSIGFGPPIPGCSYQWGETTYKLALFPLGGYVQMVGQVDGDESSDGSEDDPRSYRNKSVFQRMAIISAGVTMNVILAIVSFVIVFQGPGKDRLSPRIGLVDTGGPGFVAGLREGDEFTLIGGHKKPYFEDIKNHVMATRSGEKVTMGILPLGGTELTKEILPRKNDGDVTPVIGFAPAPRLQFLSQSYVDSSFSSPAWPGSPAARAGFKFDDRIIGMTDPDARDLAVTNLQDDPSYPGKGQCNYFEFAKRMQRLAGREVEILVERKKGEGTEQVPIKVAPAYHWSLGVVMNMGQITAIREGSPAAEAKIKARVHDKEKNVHVTGDVIVGVSIEAPSLVGASIAGVMESPMADGPFLAVSALVAGRIEWKGKGLDPLLLPDQLKRAAAELPAQSPKKVTLRLQRTRDSGAGKEITEVSEVLEWKDDWTYDRPRPLAKSSPWAIPELGLAYLVKTTVAAQIDDNKVRERAAGPADFLVKSVISNAGNPLQPEDEIKEVQIVSYNGTEGLEVNGKESLEESRWIPIESEDQWAHYYYGIFGDGMGQSIKFVNLKVKRFDQNTKKDQKWEIKTFRLVPVKNEQWPLADRGWRLMTDLRRQKAEGLFDAIALGLKDTHNSMLQVFQNLRGMIIGRLSLKLTAGPLTIANLTYKFAGLNWSELVFFLGLISVNLAVINFLPIPVLDGGHMVFLIYEKIRGQPASEAVRAWATYAGLALILSLMIAVTCLDLTRFFW